MRTAIMNLKGGTGKTVTAINTAAILARDYAQRVLLVDADSQANLTEFVAEDKADLSGALLSQLLTGKSVDAIQTTIKGVSLLAAKLAPEYGIEYRSPAFAIHRKGRYGSMVGKAFETMAEYRALVEEVKALLAAGVPAHCTAMQAIGYKEMTDAVANGGDLQAAAEEVKLRSRQYAKRQLTWFRRNKEAHWIYLPKEPDFTSVLRDSTEFLREKGLG